MDTKDSFCRLKKYAVQNAELNRLGYTRHPKALTPVEVSQLMQVCREKFEQDSNSVIARSSRGHIYAARNVIDAAPEIHDYWRKGVLREILVGYLGPDCGLVRGLFFDKPPERSWALPWHKDQSIAVRETTRASSHFSRPTVKMGVPHVIASDEVLGRMVTLRIHLDEVTDENGPLRVVPGSHLIESMNEINCDSFETIHAEAGDVLAMKPLIVHSSGSSHPETKRHRRILHLEFAAERTLPDGYQWHQFVPVKASAGNVRTNDF